MLSKQQQGSLKIDFKSDDINHLSRNKSLLIVRQIQSRHHLYLKKKMIIKLRKNKTFVQSSNKINQRLKAFIHKKQQQCKNESVSTCEFTCPICLEMLVTPCPTSCGHIFCFRCVDQSVIRNGNCPSCRNFIRNEDFIESKPFSKICNYFWLNSPDRDDYLQKYSNNKQWLSKRMINFDNLKKGDFLDVRDTQSIWCKARALQFFQTYQKTDILVSYTGWNSIYNQIININSQRLAPQNLFSSRTDIPHYQLANQQGNMRSRIQYGDQFRPRISQSDRQILSFRDGISRRLRYNMSFGPPNIMTLNNIISARIQNSSLSQSSEQSSPIVQSQDQSQQSQSAQQMDQQSNGSQQQQQQQQQQQYDNLQQFYNVWQNQMQIQNNNDIINHQQDNNNNNMYNSLIQNWMERWPSSFNAHFNQRQSVSLSNISNNNNSDNQVQILQEQQQGQQQHGFDIQQQLQEQNQQNNIDQLQQVLYLNQPIQQSQSLQILQQQNNHNNQNIQQNTMNNRISEQQNQLNNRNNKYRQQQKQQQTIPKIQWQKQRQKRQNRKQSNNDGYKNTRDNNGNNGNMMNTNKQQNKKQ